MPTDPTFPVTVPPPESDFGMDSTASRMAGAAEGAKARIAGGLWLIVIVTGAFAFYAQASLMVRGDAAATTANILASETMFRLGFAANLVAGACYLGVTVLLYGMLKRVSPSVSRLAAAFGVAGVAAGAAASLVELTPLVLLGQASYLNAFTAPQLQALSLAALRLASLGSYVGMALFGFQCALLGYLIARSSFLPRALGLLLGLGGASYVISALASFVAPAMGSRFSPFILPIAILGEGSLSLWLLVKGARVSEGE
jgi:hypothetical protein